MHPTATVILAQSHLAALYDDADRERRARAARLSRGFDRRRWSVGRSYDAVARILGSRRSSRIAASSSATIWRPSSISSSDTVP
jgi:hypothetical protein